MHEQLLELIDKWKKAAKFGFLSADQQHDQFGKRFIEHGAICYTNCVLDLKQVLSSAELLISATPREGQK